MLRIWGIEATQAIQFFRSTHPLCVGSGAAKVPCPDNGVPLVAGKPLVLRLYVSGATPGAGVGGVVSRPTSGGTYGSTFSIAGTGGTVATAAPAMRTDPSTTLQVVLKAQPAGTYAFDVVVLEYAPGWGSVVATATASITLSFTERRRIRVRLVRIHYKGRGMDVPAPSARDFWDATEFAQRVLPIPSPGFEIVRDSVADYDGDFTRIDPSAHDPMWAGYAANRGTTGNLLNILDVLAAAESLPGDVVYVAIYPDGVNQAAFSGWAVGRWIISDRGPETFAHEILHKSGSPQHAPCGGPAWVDPNYPDYPSFSALPAASIGEVGLDPVSLKTYDPLSTYDLMSYCGPKWISPYNFTRAFDSLPPLPPPPPAGPGPGDRFVDVRFARFPDRWVVLDLPGFARPRPPRPPLERGALEVVVRDRDGSILFRGPVPVTRPLEEADQEIPDLVETEVPWFEDATAVELVRRDETLALLPVDPPPEIEVEFPKQGELEEGRGTLSYRVRAESERLAVAVRVTDDGGATWTGTVFREREGQLDVGPLLEQCAGECCLEVLATSGYHATVERSTPFQVVPREREILAWASAPGERVTAGEPVHLHAVALGGAAPSDALLWYSDRDGDLGRGARLPVTLRPGRHRIEVRTTLPFHRSAQLDLDVEPIEGPGPGSADPRGA
jgi:hypothetical protein